MSENMVTMTFEVTEVEREQLWSLARAQKLSPSGCIRRFIQTCQPGGSGWKHPASNIVKKEVKDEVATASASSPHQ